jgi:hypothetical protein
VDGQSGKNQIWTRGFAKFSKCDRGDYALGVAPLSSAQVRSHGKPGQVGEPGAPVLLFLLGVFYGSCSEGVDRRLLRYVSCWFVDQVFVDLGVFQSGAS